MLTDTQETIFVDAIFDEICDESQYGYEWNDGEREVNDKLPIDEFEVLLRKVEFGTHRIVRTLSEHSAAFRKFRTSPSQNDSPSVLSRKMENDKEKQLKTNGTGQTRDRVTEVL
jgi:hypothetical protein